MTLGNENNKNNKGLFAGLKQGEKWIAESLLNGDEPEFIIHRMTLDGTLSKTKAKAYVTEMQKYLELKNAVITKKQKVTLEDNDIKTNGIFTTNEDGVFVIYPTEMEVINETDDEIFIASKIFLGPNETSISDKLKMVFVIPIDKGSYEVAATIVKLYKEKLEKELSEIGRVQIKTNPQ